MAKVVVAVLDWGLGHASRCIPLIRELEAEGNQVILASSGSALQLLSAECPKLPMHILPAYRIRYFSRRMWWTMLRQAPRMAWVSWLEHRQLQGIIAAEQADFIISDGRFGCYNTAVRSIWLAHQLHIQYANGWIRKILNSLYHRYIQVRFTEVWVPDWEQPRGLAGALSAPISNLPHRYLGPLSRFHPLPSSTRFTYDWLVLLSGPEPQRTLLEEEVRQQLTGRQALIVRGVPGSTEIKALNTNVSVVDWLHGSLLSRQVQQAKWIICRSGYSSLMDLNAWQKKAVLIPTPGQTEQEYLADYWQAKQWAIVQQQEAIDLSAAERQLPSVGLIDSRK